MNQPASQQRPGGPALPASSGQTATAGRSGWLWRGAVVLGAVGLAAALRWGLDNFWGKGYTFITFYPVVAIVGIVAGGRAGLAATALSAVAADYFFIEPRGHLAIDRPGDWVALGLFVVAGVLISWIAGEVGRARRAEGEAAERAKSAQRFYAILSNMYSSVLLVTNEGKVEFANRAFCDQFGLADDPADLVGLQANEMIEKIRQAYAQPEAAATRIREIVARGEPVRGEEFAMQNGRTCLRDFVPLKLHGEPYGRLWIHTDVSDIRQAREVLARSKQELERLVAERTAKLEELVGELEHFSYTITHDMRAPLRAMKGFGEVVNELCAECPAQEPRGFLQRIIVSADRMDALIRDALSYSRAVRQELPLDRVDPGALLRGMLDSYPEFQRSKAKIEIENELPLVMGNEAGLTQCFSNLLGNAVKFVDPNRRPEIRIRAELRQGWVRIWVEDNGIGISKEMLPRVFDMFSRGQKGYDGTGVGLALVRKVIDRMRGRLGVESVPGAGSRFWIELRPAG